MSRGLESGVLILELPDGPSQPLPGVFFHQKIAREIRPVTSRQYHKSIGYLRELLQRVHEALEKGQSALEFVQKKRKKKERRGGNADRFEIMRRT